MERMYDLKEVRAKLEKRNLFGLSLYPRIDLNNDSRIFFTKGLGSISLTKIESDISYNDLFITEDEEFLVFMGRIGDIKVVPNLQYVSRFHNYAIEHEIIKMLDQGLIFEEIFAILLL